MQDNTKLDFSGQDIYIGLDIHKKNWTVSILTENFEHKTFSQNPDVELLVRYLRRNFPGATYHSAYEAGYCGFWIDEALRAHGINNMVIHPADVPTKDKERRRKTNRVDSRKIARSLRNGDLEGIFVPDSQALKDRSLIRARRNAVKDQTRVKNRIKAYLSYFGIGIPEQFAEGRWSGAFLDWIESVSSEHPSLRYYVHQLRFYRDQVAKLNRSIRQLAKHLHYKENVRLLKTIPGVGILTAMILLLELVDIARFKNLDFMASFVGLVPGEHSSGAEEEIHTTGITSRSHHYLRGLLIEAAWVAIRKDPALLLAYNRLIKRMSKQQAIIRIAKKLLNRIRYVLKNQHPYVISVMQ